MTGGNRGGVGANAGTRGPAPSAAVNTTVHVSPTATPAGPPPYRLGDMRAATAAWQSRMAHNAATTIAAAAERPAARPPAAWTDSPVAGRGVSTFQVWA